MRLRNKIVIATAIVLGLAVYMYVMMVCLLHERPVEKAARSGTQVATVPKKEDVTAPPRQVYKPRPSRPAVPPRTRPPTARRTEGPLIGNQAPDFVLRDLDDRQVELSSFKGKMVILDFWATWCPPCVREIPHFIELYEKYGDRGLVMLGVSTDRNGVSVVNSFVRRHKVNYPILMADVKVKEAYGGIRSIPTTFVIDTTGKIQRRYVGYRDKAVFEADIKALLVPGESLIADLKSEDPSVRLDAAESLVTRESSLEPEVFLRFCKDLAETASKNLDIAVRMHKVTAQYLSQTQLSDEDLACLKGLPSPGRLEFDNMPITDAGLAYIGRLSSLRSLSLRHTQITDTGMGNLKDLILLVTLRLEGTKITSEGLAHLKGLSSLNTLYLGDTKVSDTGLLHLKNLTQLQRFCVHNTQITDTGLAYLSGLTKLKYLCIHDTKVSDAGLEYLTGLTSLETLFLHNTRVSDNGLAFLKNLNSLEKMTLAGTQVTEKGVSELKQALPSCSISGPRPAR